MPQVPKANLVAGALTLVLASIAGFALAAGMEANFAEGFLQLTYPKALVKAAHSHGQPFGLFNLLVAVLMPHLGLEEKERLWLGRLAILALAMPVGLGLRGLMEGSWVPAPLSFLGGFSFLGATLLLLKGGWAKRPA